MKSERKKWEYSWHETEFVMVRRFADDMYANSVLRMSTTIGGVTICSGDRYQSPGTASGSIGNSKGEKWYVSLIRETGI